MTTSFSIINLKKFAFDKLKFQAIQDWITGVVQWQNPVVLSDATTILWNPSKNYNAKITLVANRTLSVQGLKPGLYGTIEVVQGGAGNFTLTLPSNSVVLGTQGGSVITLSTNAGAVDLVTFYYNGTTIYWTISLY